MTTTNNTYKGFAGCPEALIDKVKNIETISNQIQDELYHWSADGNSFSHFCRNISHCLMRYIAKRQDALSTGVRYTEIVKRICTELPKVQIMADFCPGYYDDIRTKERENEQLQIINNTEELINKLNELFELMK